MATVHQAVQSYPRQQGANRVQLITWGAPTSVMCPGGQTNTPLPITDLNGEAVYSANTPIASGDTCVPVYIPAQVDRCLQITGVADGATVNVVGSNDGVNFVTIHDSFGNALTNMAVGAIAQLMESCAWLNIVPVGGAGTTAINGVLKCRGSF